MEAESNISANNRTTNSTQSINKQTISATPHFSRLKTLIKNLDLKILRKKYRN